VVEVDLALVGGCLARVADDAIRSEGGHALFEDQLHLGLAGGTEIGGADQTGADPAWSEGLGGEPDPEVDEEALARAMALDELRDVTPQELAEFDARLAGSDPQPEIAIEIDADTDDEEPQR